MVKQRGFKSVKIVSRKHGLHFMLVDNEDYELFADVKWYLCWRNNPQTYYAARYIIVAGEKKVLEYAHRLIVNCQNGFEVDHINHKGLDNRRKFLRLVTRSQNACNIEKRTPHSSKFKGVHWDTLNDKWRVAIMINYKKIDLGRFEDERDAALAYNKASELYHGKFGRKNYVL